MIVFGWGVDGVMFDLMFLVLIVIGLFALLRC